MKSLDSLFRPRSIAILGASHKPGKVGFELVKNIVEAGFQGRIYPINPKGGEILGYKVYRTLHEVEDDIDLLLIALPTKYILESIEEAGKKGVKSAVIYAAGFAEIGREDLQNELVKLVKKYGIRVIGPNCAGIIYWGSRLNASFSPVSRDGFLGLLSQSGAMTAVISEYLEFKELGLRLLVSYGNRIDVKDHEIIEYFNYSDDIRTFMIYIEGLDEGDGRRLYKAIRNSLKPIVIFKTGRGESGSRAAYSHTAALAGRYNVFRDIMFQAGAYVVDEYYELVDVAEALSIVTPPRGKEVAIVTNSGGPAVTATDKLEELGISLHTTPPDIVDKLDFLQPYMNKGNPIDLTADGNEDYYRKVLETLLESKWPDIIYVIHVPPTFINPHKIAEAVRNVYLEHNRKKTLIPLFLGRDRWKAYKIIREAGLPTPLTHISAAKTIHALIKRVKI